MKCLEGQKIQLKTDFIRVLGVWVGKVFIFFSFVLRIKDKNKKLPEINDLFMSNHQTKNCIEDKLTEYINDYKTNSESLEGINLTHKI